MKHALEINGSPITVHRLASGLKLRAEVAGIVETVEPGEIISICAWHKGSKDLRAELYKLGFVLSDGMCEECSKEWNRPKEQIAAAFYEDVYQKFGNKWKCIGVRRVPDRNGRKFGWEGKIEFETVEPVFVERNFRSETVNAGRKPITVRTILNPLSLKR